MKRSILLTLGLAVLAGIAISSPAFAVANIDFAFVGNPGNAHDTSGYGGVSYAYNIAKNETTISQYAEFLNAVAKTDNYGLYSSNMTTSYINGISQSGSSGSFSYSVASGSGNKPITYVSWFDAARFCNWLHNGQQTGEGAALTAETGAYTLNGATNGIIGKNVAATVWVPSENEWYKAAYYDPTKDAGAGGYWRYPTQSNLLPGNIIGIPNSANYYDGGHVGFPGAALTDVGAYGGDSDSYFGTNDQGGNVWEWNDAEIDGSRGLRGGSWDSIGGLDSSNRYGGFGPSYEAYDIGFRVASVPEPSAIVMMILLSAALVTRRNR